MKNDRKRRGGLSPVLFVLLLTTVVLTSTAQAKTYTRIISLYSAHTENLVSLGAMEQIIGISRSDNFPPEVLSKKRFSYREDPERFIAEQPDLILVRPMIERSYPQLIAKLRNAGIDVISLQPTSVDEIFSYWRKLGELSGRKEEAEQMIFRFSEQLEEIEKKVAPIPAGERPGVYFESMHRKMKTFAPTSIALFALQQAGGRNVALDAKQVRNTNIAMYSKERILAHAEEIDVFIAQKGRMNPIDRDTIRNETGFQIIKAVRQDRIVLVDEHLVSRPTMRLIEGIRFLNGQLYPGQLTLNGDGGAKEKGR